MDEFLHHVAIAVCGADPQLGSEWYELLGRSAPVPDDPEWANLVERLTDVAANAGAHTEGLMEALAAEHDPAELQATIAAMVWPETAADQAQPAGAQEDEAAWNTYLQTNGPSWDGTDASWAAFVEWFVYHADEQHVGGFARSFCAYAAENGAAAVFAQYGVTLSAAAVPGSAEAPAGEGSAEPEPSGAKEAGMSVDQVVAEYGPALYAEFRDANPELADLTDEELAIVLAEALTGQAELAALGTK